MKDIQTGVDDRHAPTQPEPVEPVEPVDPLEQALKALARVHRLSALTPDERLQAEVCGASVGVQQRAYLDYAQAHALVSIAESLRTIARRSQP